MARTTRRPAVACTRAMEDGDMTYDPTCVRCRYTRPGASSTHADHVVTTPTLHYHWGQNMPGYMPMADEPNTADTRSGAVAGLLDDMERIADSEYEEESDEETTMAEAIDAAMETFRSWDAETDGLTTELTVYAASSRAHDLGLAFWVVACNETECETDEDGD